MPETSASIESGLETLDYAAILLYMVGTFGISIWFGRRQKSVDDFFVGGRSMPWFAVGLSIMATLFSTLTYLGAPGEMIKNGIALSLGTLAVPFSICVVFFLWIPFFMRLRVTSAYEYLEWRFNYAVRAIAATLFLLLRLGWMSMVIFAASMAIDRVKGDDYALLPGPDIYWWIAAVGLFAAIYTAVGGIQAMIWTDVLQCLLLLAGVLMAIVYVVFVDQTGPADWWQTAATHAPKHTSPPLFTTNVMVRNTVLWVVLGNFFWTICTHGSDQVVLQRYFSTASMSAARRSYLINVAVDFGMTILLGMAGLALLSFYLHHSDLLPEGWTAIGAADKLFPHFLGHQLPAGCAGLVMSAFICDAMQTLESGANAITAVVSNDFVPRLRRGGERMTSELTFARLLSLVVTLIVTANAVLVAQIAQQGGLTLVDMMPKFFNMFVGPLAALFMIGMFLKHTTARSAIPAVLIGVTISIFWSWYPEIFRTDSKPTVFLAIAVPCLTTVIAAGLFGYLFESGKPHAGQDFTWSAVLNRPHPTEKGLPKNGV